MTVKMEVDVHEGSLRELREVVNFVILHEQENHEEINPWETNSVQKLFWKARG